MARNDGLDGLDALLGFGILGTMMGGDPLKKTDPDVLKRRMNEVYGKKPTPAEGAEAAKKIYDSYVNAGFNEIQAFELLKLVLNK